MKAIAPPEWVREIWGGRVPWYIEEVVELADGRTVKWWAKNPRVGAPNGWAKSGQHEVKPYRSNPP